VENQVVTKRLDGRLALYDALALANTTIRVATFSEAA
jgi:hypothetical protein